jgi:uncharacterized protein DUF732
MTLRLIAAALAAAAIPFGNATAHAVCDAKCIDESFIQALDILGVGVQYTDESRIVVAHQVCAKYDEGFGDVELFVIVSRDTVLSRYQASELVGAAASSYCPQYNGYVPSRRTFNI